MYAPGSLALTAAPERSTYCLCGTSDDGRLMLECTANAEGCGGWIHPDCFQLGPQALAAAEHDENWVCPLCRGEIEDVPAARAYAKALTSHLARLATASAPSAPGPPPSLALLEDDSEEPSDVESDGSDAAAPAKKARVSGASKGKAKKFKRPDAKAKPGAKPKKPAVRSPSPPIPCSLLCARGGVSPPVPAPPGVALAHPAPRLGSCWTLLPPASQWPHAPLLAALRWSILRAAACAHGAAGLHPCPRPSAAKCAFVG